MQLFFQPLWLPFHLPVCHDELPRVLAAVPRLPYQHREGEDLHGAGAGGRQQGEEFSNIHKAEVKECYPYKLSSILVLIVPSSDFWLLF